MSLLDDNNIERLDYEVLYRKRFEEIEKTLNQLPDIIYTNTDMLRENISEYKYKLDLFEEMITSHENEILTLHHKIDVLTNMINSLLSEDKYINFNNLN